MNRTKFLLCLILTSLTACENGPSPQIDYCSQFRAIYLNNEDHLTPETGREILQHDMIGHDLCGWPYA